MAQEMNPIPVKNPVVKSMATLDSGSSKKGLIWGIIIAIALIIIGIFVFTGGNDSSTTNTGSDAQQGTELPSTQEETYNSLETSNDDFSALDEALETLE